MSSQNITSKIALPYAEALLEFTQENNCIVSINKDVSLVMDLLSQYSQLQAFLNNPLLPSVAKKNVLSNLLMNQVNIFTLKFWV